MPFELHSASLPSNPVLPVHPLHLLPQSLSHLVALPVLERPVCNPLSKQNHKEAEVVAGVATVDLAREEDLVALAGTTEGQKAVLMAKVSKDDPHMEVNVLQGIETTHPRRYRRTTSPRRMMKDSRSCQGERRLRV